MPKLIRLYITSVAIGFGLAAAFVAMLVWFDVAGLGHLVLETSSGWIAGLMLWVSNGVIFAATQFGIAVMNLAEKDETPRGGRRQLRPVPIRVEVATDPVKRQIQRRSR
jgi:hypothetical protein